MQFNSLAYFAFLAVALLTAMRLPHRAQNLWLVVLSYVFYAFWNWKFCGLMLAATALGFWPALRIQGARSNGDETLAKRWMVCGVSFALAILAIFKYANFFIDSFGTLLHRFLPGASLSTLSIVLPVGISFYTFHTISYVVDVYRKDVEPTKDFVELALFLSFFPQLVAGPIARSTSLLPQCQKPRSVTETMVRNGMYLILFGLFRKVVIADTAGALVDLTYADPERRSWFLMVQSVMWYSLQIYSDFAGYTDIARGSALLFGFKLSDNFHHPYLSANVREFWQRWHISLSTWLRDYLYIPLGGNRKGKLRTYVNLFATMLLGGLWHGASWNFVIWGGLHGLYLAIGQALGIGRTTGKKNWISVVFTFALVSLTWIFFRSPSFDETRLIFQKLANFRHPGYQFPIASIFLLAMMAMIDLPQVLGKSEMAVLTWKPIPKVVYCFSMIALLVFSGDISGGVFIYFQF
ncbi:MAG: MBOAT family protein [Armatimonadetes bacterium]|nr:MBOAT family protein [Armatimonadota bacterium]